MIVEIVNMNAEKIPSSVVPNGMSPTKRAHVALPIRRLMTSPRTRRPLSSLSGVLESEREGDRVARMRGLRGSVGCEDQGVDESGC